MSPALDTRVREALDARAAATATSPDAWARIGHHGARRDRRRTAILRVAAAAVVGVLALGGTIAVLTRRGGESATVATSTPAGDDTAAAESLAPDGGTGETREAPVDLRISAVGEDRSVTFLRGEEVLGVVSVPADASETAGGWVGPTVFGVAATGATQVRLVVEGVVFTGPVEIFTDPAVAGRVLFAAEGVPAGLLQVESIDAAGNMISGFGISHRG